MHGTMTVCVTHSQVFDSSKREWQCVPLEMMEELFAMVEEIGEIKVYEGCCPDCSGQIIGSHELYENRYASAMYAELGGTIVDPVDI